MATESAIAAAPSSVIVGPYTCTVNFDPEASYDYSFMGVWLSVSKRIKLCPRQSDTELPQTLLHEVLHALGQVYEIPEWSRHKTDEHQHVMDKIDLMATALLRWMRDNPDVVKWMQEQR